jgi:ketosteroid isomerase-like protein
VEDEQDEQRAVTDLPTFAADDPAVLAARYAAAWQAQDWSALRALLADDVTFRGPLGTADSCIAGLQRMAQVLDHLEVHARASHGSDVLTWFDLHSTVAPATPTANWTRVENGRITEIRVAFDPRALLAGLEASRDASTPPTRGPDSGR